MHTRPRVRRAPGLPCALDLREPMNLKTSDAWCRENEDPCFTLPWRGRVDANEMSGGVGWRCVEDSRASLRGFIPPRLTSRCARYEPTLPLQGRVKQESAYVKTPERKKPRPVGEDRRGLGCPVAAAATGQLVGA